MLTFTHFIYWSEKTLFTFQSFFSIFLKYFPFKIIHIHWACSLIKIMLKCLITLYNIPRRLQWIKHTHYITSKVYTGFPCYSLWMGSRLVWIREYRNRHFRLNLMKFPSLFTVFLHFLLIPRIVKTAKTKSANNEGCLYFTCNGCKKMITKFCSKKTTP